MPSSWLKCSAAKVGPNLSSSEPEYFFLIKFKTRRRSFSPLLRFEGWLAFPCLSPWLATCRYLRHHLFVLRSLSSRIAAASLSFRPPLPTRPITSTRFSSRLLMLVLFNRPPLAGGLSLRGHF